MTKLMNIAMNALAMELENNLFSKVEGRRNWVIRVQTSSQTGNRFIYYKGGFGKACRLNCMEAYLRDIANEKIRWYEFTYKKDYLKALEILKECGIE